jgi:hypothetical protein
MYPEHDTPAAACRRSSAASTGLGRRGRLALRLRLVALRPYTAPGGSMLDQADAQLHRRQRRGGRWAQLLQQDTARQQVLAHIAGAPQRQR